MNTEPTEPKNINDTLPPPPVIQDGSEFGAAYERRLAEIKAVPEEKFASLNLDVVAAVATVLGALPTVRSLRDEMARIPQVDLALVDGLEEYAEAAGEANSRFVVATTPEEDIVALNDEGMTIRETLHSDALALAHRGLIDRSLLSKFEGLVGYKNVGSDLINWSNLMLGAWPAIQGKTALTLEEVQKAKHLGERLVRAAGLRDLGPTAMVEVARIRLQAISLMVDAYEEARRGIAFLRWREDDVDTIAPSLYAVRGRKHSSDNAKPAPEPAPAAPEAPHANGGVATGPGASAPTPAPGMPGTSPFVHA
jgi:hypothetical protein